VALFPDHIYRGGSVDLRHSIHALFQKGHTVAVLPPGKEFAMNSSTVKNSTVMKKVSTAAPTIHLVAKRHQFKLQQYVPPSALVSRNDLESRLVESMLSDTQRLERMTDELIKSFDSVELQQISADDMVATLIVNTTVETPHIGDVISAGPGCKWSTDEWIGSTLRATRHYGRIVINVVVHLPPDVDILQAASPMNVMTLLVSSVNRYRDSYTVTCKLERLIRLNE
jgi:hypothetical protein